ncbi:MAG: SRPBCC family protein [Gammaproteobacteria bacterium]|nr:SRPBCC family protein [Gammaproteobacteria bacterium]
MNRRNFQLSLVAIFFLFNSLPLSAHGPTRQKVTEFIEIDAPASKVWDLIKDFDKAHQWLPMVESTTGEGGNAPGATRVLSLGGDAKVYETLKAYNAEKMTYSYKIPVKTHDVSILPVNNYSSTISVKNKGGKTVVTWKGAFYRGYPNNDPPAELNDEAAIAAVTGLYQAGLAHLKEVAEKQ